MGEAINHNVAITLETGEESVLNRLGIIEDGHEKFGKAYIFAQVRSEDDDCLAYLVVARNEDEGKALKDYFADPAVAEAGALLGNIQQSHLAARGELLQPAAETSDSQRVFRSCCSMSRNVGVLLVGRPDPSGPFETATLLDRKVKANFIKEDENGAELRPEHWKVSGLQITREES